MFYGSQNSTQTRSYIRSSFFYWSFFTFIYTCGGLRTLKNNVTDDVVIISHDIDVDVPISFNAAAQTLDTNQSVSYTQDFEELLEEFNHSIPELTDEDLKQYIKIEEEPIIIKGIALPEIPKRNLSKEAIKQYSYLIYNS